MSGRIGSILLLGLIGIGWAEQPAFGQAGNVPVISGVFPPSATIGEAAEWAISGSNLARVKTLMISGRGVEVVDLSSKGETSAVARIRVAADAEPGFREVRLDGPAGISNLVLIRVDRLPQVVEVEPNELASKAQEVGEGSAVVGVLKALDVDHFRIKGTPGRRLTLDLETRRVGTSIAPVMTAFAASGTALIQGRESKSNDHDCRLTVVMPPEGSIVVQVRDNLYGGSDQANYRLRVDPAPYATGLFPLGGPKGQAVEFEASGGNLDGPRKKSIKLPDSPGSTLDPGNFDGSGGPSAGPARIVVGDGPELTEPLGRPEGQAMEVSTDVTVNGRIGRPGEVDLYRFPVKAGETVRFRILAAGLGSWLDSVITLRDEKGATLEQNDDSNNAFAPDQDRTVNAVGIPERTPDSALAYEVKADGLLTLEVADRFGDGGPEYGYRLAIGPSRPDYAVTLLLGNANANSQAIARLSQVKTPRVSPGQFGVFNLKPGSSTPLNFLVVPDGRPGPVEVRIEGLPEGVTAEPVRVRLASPAPAGSTSSIPIDGTSVADFFLLKVSTYAQPGLGELRIVARSDRPGVPPFREGSATIGIDASAGSGRPITRLINRFPIRILGEARPQFVGPPAPPTLKKVSVPGPLLQGDQLDLALEFQGAVSADDGSVIEARAEGVGLATSTVISAGTSLDEEGAVPDVTIHVLASIKAELGVHRVNVTYTPDGGPTASREVMVEVKAPIEVKASAESIFLNPGDHASFRVEIRREAGFDGEVELKLEGLPRGVKMAEGVTILTGKNSAEVRLEMNPEARPISKATEMRVVGMARMSRGNVSIESKNRPLIRARPADK